MTVRRLSNILTARIKGILLRWIFVCFRPAYTALVSPNRAADEIRNTIYSKQSPKSPEFHTVNEVKLEDGTNFVYWKVSFDES